jgi:hypothetical protein
MAFQKKAIYEQPCISRGAWFLRQNICGLLPFIVHHHQFIAHLLQSPASDKIPHSPLFSLPDLELSRSNNGFPSPDSFVAATHDPEYLHLKENIRRIRKAPFGPDPKKVDAVWEVYKKVRDENLQLCKSLLQKSRKIFYVS